ncbi:MAG: hypothetical protein KKH88_03985 [Nanoarchaeota archaeon]|nr:hypothetical protein [Nanoarchaeota archaeon]
MANLDDRIYAHSGDLIPEDFTPAQRLGALEAVRKYVDLVACTANHAYQEVKDITSSTGKETEWSSGLAHILNMVPLEDTEGTPSGEFFPYWLFSESIESAYGIKIKSFLQLTHEMKRLKLELSDPLNLMKDPREKLLSFLYSISESGGRVLLERVHIITSELKCVVDMAESKPTE